MDRPEITDAAFEVIRGDVEHEAGCTYGGLSCRYWLVVETCERDHWERHVVTDDGCPCGHTFPGAGTGVVFSAE